MAKKLTDAQVERLQEQGRQNWNNYHRRETQRMERERAAAESKAKAGK